MMAKHMCETYTCRIQFSNIAQLKMVNKIEAEIMTDGWPEFSCTAIKLPNSEVVRSSMKFV